VPLVLLVEDHPDTRLMYAEFLRDGFDVIQASEGDEALRAMRTRVPDLVITDLSLPGVDGFELMIRMRQDASLAEVPVICLSGYSGHSHEQRAREAGCDRLIQKPCLPETLADAATDLLRERNARRQAR
jgi:CheY-like chemotaxis protein